VGGSRRHGLEKPKENALRFIRAFGADGFARRDDSLLIDAAQDPIASRIGMKPRQHGGCQSVIAINRGAVRQATSPDEDLMRFLANTYEAAADLGDWERSALERVGGTR